MKKSIHWIIAAVIIVALIILVATFEPQELEVETSILGFDQSDVFTVEETNLRLSVPMQDDFLEYSSNSEVYRFSLEADTPYTLRYLTFAVDYSGLQESAIGHASSWKIYAINEGIVDYSDTLGFGESMDGGLMRVRMLSNRSAGYAGAAGVSDFALTTTALRDFYAEDNVKMVISMPTDLSAKWDWAWVPGIYLDAWMGLDDSFGIEFVDGLPGKTVSKY